jgi:hypothetical protein
VILMTYDRGSAGEEIACGVAECLSLELIRQRCVAELPRSLVWRMLLGRGSRLEDWGIDRPGLDRLLAAEEVSLAAKGNVIIQATEPIPELRVVNHVLFVHVCVSDAPSAATARGGAGARRMRGRAKYAWLRPQACRHNPKNYDLVINAERIPVAECIAQVKRLAQSPHFRPTPASETTLANLLGVVRRPRQAPAQVWTSGVLAGVVTVGWRRVQLAGVEGGEEAIARVESHLRGDRPPDPLQALLPPPGLIG